jgi:2,3-bisphosphoglycerate-dependent phosphoglycerate mutase
MADQAERTLILVRHSLPEMATRVPASSWRLSDKGRRRCEALAELLAGYRLARVVTSAEAKAVETGRIVARDLDVPLEIAADLHEHERGVVESISDSDEFQAQVADLFRHPGETIFGLETADEAHRRFSLAVTDVLERHPTGNLAIVTHGTVLSLYVTRMVGLEPVAFWKSLGLPSFVVLSLPGFELLRVVEHV